MEIKKLYHKIAEVADLLQESASTIRFWCKEFGVEPKRRNGIRLFMEKDLIQLRTISYLLRNKKHTFAGVHQILLERNLAVETRPTRSYIRKNPIAYAQAAPNKIAASLRDL